MKEVMQQFEDRTSQRFHEYDERMKTTRQKCREQCDKEIQKIILKDKLEKELMDKIVTLDTDIQNDAIPTCICEKSIEDKVEKTCLKCGGVFGGIAPSVGLLGGIGEAAISVLKPLAIEAAKKAAIAKATDLATQAGMREVVLEIEEFLKHFTKREGLVNFTSVVNEANFKSATALFQNAKELLSDSCIPDEVTKRTNTFCNSTIYHGGVSKFNDFTKAGATKYETIFSSKSATLTDTKVGAVEATYGGYHISIIASIVAIVVIVLIMVIIYLILRYRRKKKMKKKLQYIKLLEE
ncbi:hypothetical protein PFMC_05290 [Plasmodium falciparum CAMP/Malaysia]|nr:hypothetical protein PFMC_05290 [Plasmodium falciparum CAMP/Malaysia]